MARSPTPLESGIRPHDLGPLDSLERNNTWCHQSCPERRAYRDTKPSRSDPCSSWWDLGIILRDVVGLECSEVFDHTNTIQAKNCVMYAFNNRFAT